MQEDHPSLETLARWLAGELEHDEVLREVVPHLERRCAICKEQASEIRRLREESGHWSEVVAVLETREAPVLAARLEELPHEEAMRLVEMDEDLHRWGLCQLLATKSREVVFSDPAKAVELAHLAVRLTGHLGAAYDSNWVADLRARSLASLGNARRALGELKAADVAFLGAEASLERSTTGNLQVRADVLSLKASLRLDQRRLDEALELVESALSLYREAGDQQGVGKALMKKAKVFQVRGDLGRAIEVLKGSQGEIQQTGDPRLLAFAQQNLLFYLSLAGRPQEAQQLLPEVRDLYRRVAGPFDLLRLTWTEASIAHGLSCFEQAEAGYREVQEKFLEAGKGYDAALVSLDLAVLYAETGRTEELKRLAVQLMPVFESREVHRETIAALLLFQQACLEERTTVEMVRHLGAQIRQRGRSQAG